MEKYETFSRFGLESHLNDKLFKLNDYEKYELKNEINEDIIKFNKILFEKIHEYIKKDYKLNQYNKILINQNGISLTTKGEITAENVGEAVLGLVEYIRETRPTQIVACDRGARLIGLAVFRLYAELYGSLPTYDTTLRFRRISHSNSYKQTREHLKPVIEETMRANPAGTILFLDDWVTGGRTQHMVKRIVHDVSRGTIDTKFGVLTGYGADVTGAKQKSGVDWHDDPGKIGVTYKGFKPVIVRSGEARNYRRRMFESIEQLAKRIKTKKK